MKKGGSVPGHDRVGQGQYAVVIDAAGAVRGVRRERAVDEGERGVGLVVLDGTATPAGRVAREGGVVDPERAAVDIFNAAAVVGCAIAENARVIDRERA